MTKAELIERIARSRDLPPDLSKKCIATVLDLAFEELASYFAKARLTRTRAPRFTFPGFGTFTKKRRSARQGVNPRTLEPMRIDATCTVDFKPSVGLREALNNTRVRLRQDDEAGEGEGRRVARLDHARARAAAPAESLGRPRMTPRDEEAELDALIDDEALFPDGDELPATPLRRVAASGPAPGARAPRSLRRS